MDNRANAPMFKDRVACSALAFLLSCLFCAFMTVPAYAYEQVEDTVSYGHGYNGAEYLVIHETANPGASAYNHTLLWSRDDTYAVHYVMELDGSVVYHTVPDWALCWHVGNGNYSTIGIELAHATNWDDFSSQWDNAVSWAGDYLVSRGWGTDRLLSHNMCRYWWGGTDHTDPDGYFAEYGRSWSMFVSDVEDYIGGGYSPSASEPSRRPYYEESGDASNVDTSITYAASTDASGYSWLPEMVDHVDTGGSGDTFAGDGCNPIRWLAIDMPGWYQVCTEASGWLDPVYSYDKGDLMYGAAGDGSPITKVRCYYDTQDPATTGWLVAEYNVNGLPDMRDLSDTGGSWDDFAGNGGRTYTFSLQAAA